ncbi:MAG TPA: sulfatase [Thermoanaerobaculia bacterium]|nr:sulfatase [Thermoanaerobaculia bacterium]
MRSLLWIVLAAAGLLLPGSPSPHQVSETAAASRSNILVIMTDDQRLDDQRVLARTRALLAARGTTFDNSFVSYALCCPSRATFLTGQYPHNHGVLANSGPNGGYSRLDSSNTVAVWLQEAGYYTAHVGKYLNGYGTASPEPPAGWARWFGLIDPSTYKYFGYSVSADGVPVTYGDSAADYQTDVLAAEAERIIRSRAGSDRPFFLSVAPLAPHLERIGGQSFPPRPAPRHEDAFADEPLPATPAFDEPDVSDKPAHIRRLTPLAPAKENRALANHRGRLASLLAVDEMVERLVEALAETGQLDRTVIIFTSDNGFFLGEHRIPDGKYFPYEEAVRVPLIVRGGGFPAGARVGPLVSNIDLAPTLVALSGARPRRAMDGRSLLPLALDPRQGKGRTLLIEGFNPGRARPSFKAVRDARWLYAEHATGDPELYDLQTDPHQLRSRHTEPLGIRKDLARRLARLRNCAGASCR